MPLGHTIQPSLKFEPTLSGKTEDEMAIDYFVTKFGFSKTINITSSQTAGTVILNQTLGPSYTTSTVNERIMPKPYQLLGTIFNHYRGNIRIRIKFVKTKMHAARLAFCYLPGVLSDVTTAQMEYVHREIVDISAIDELCYELPYASQFPYLQTQGLGTASNYGSFQIVVINPLQAPSTVANNIDLLIELAMGEGSEWFSLAPVSYQLPTLALASVTASTETKAARNPLLNQPQSGLTAPTVQVATLSDAIPTGHQIETSQLCVGEKILSLRQLIKVPCDLVSSAEYITVTSNSAGNLAPMFFNPFLIGGTDPSGALSIRTNDLLAQIAPYFRFSRGSMRVRGDFGNSTAFPQPWGLGTYVSATCKPVSNQGICGIDSSPATGAYTGELQSVQEGFWKFTVPPYQMVPMIPHHYARSDSPINTNNISRQNSLQIRGSGFGISGNYIIKMSRQPADDYELIGFIGPPYFTNSVS